MVRPRRLERNTAARSFRQLKRFRHVINSDEVFGTHNTFWNPGPAPARPLEVIAPAGFESYFIELAEASDPHRGSGLATKYGVTYSSDWVADLTSRYNLKLLEAVLDRPA